MAQPIVRRLAALGYRALGSFPLFVVVTAFAIAVNMLNLLKGEPWSSRFITMFLLVALCVLLGMRIERRAGWTKIMQSFGSLPASVAYERDSIRGAWTAFVRRLDGELVTIDLPPDLDEREEMNAYVFAEMTNDGR